MTSSSTAAKGLSWRHLLLLLAAAVLAWVGDFLSKEWVLANFQEGESRQMLGEALRFTFVRNPGAAFSIASGMTWIFTIIATAVAVGIIVIARRLRSISWALILGGLLGGTLGNLFDRLTREPGGLQGHVIDFIHVWGFPAIFNVADIAIVASMGGLILAMLVGVGVDGSRAETDENDGVDPASATDADLGAEGDSDSIEASSADGAEEPEREGGRGV